MSHWKPLLMLILLTGSAAFAATAAGQFQLPAWVSAPQSGTKSTLEQDQAFHNLAPGRYDRNNDGRIDLIVVDRNGDGRADYWATDRDFDGLIDDYQYDRNFDGKVDQWEYDLDHDGVSDKIYVDANNDGKPDMYAELNPFTKSYTWYGDLKDIHGSRKVAFPAVRPVLPTAMGGRPTFSE